MRDARVVTQGRIAQHLDIVVIRIILYLLDTDNYTILAHSSK